ncbi:rhomboid family intramembrane serine protease [Nocardia sp. NBC_01327]|uniref:rhomboid family intramembrane serine protease n=1 Tax=Nocardia sp. NBC_01327 TaxID=2903593 RepID=UPI002E14B4BA|nr:rhomboid family intramembrane serine protease [Nocardia sp. NBC_01327]
MSAMLYNPATAALFVLMFVAARTLVDAEGKRWSRIPWAALALTVTAITGVLVQLLWSGAMDHFDSDPSKTGWWRPVTSVFMQNGGVSGTLWNLATLAIMAALAEWIWGAPLMLALFAAGALLPGHVDALVGITSVSSASRNFAGSSAATYFLGATVAAVLLLRTPAARERLLALAAPTLGLILWFAQDNAHGLVVVYGFVLGLAVALCGRAAVSMRRRIRVDHRQAG